jgi:hypothetical protein
VPLGAAWRWLVGGGERQARVVAAARDLISSHRDRARYVAIDFARQTRDGKLVEHGKDAQFWWRVALEIDKIEGRAGSDTATR